MYASDAEGTHDMSRPSCTRHASAGAIHANSRGLELGFRSTVLIASLSFDVRPEKRGELASAVSHIVQTLRWSSGCLGCRLVADCENPNLFTLFSEWDNQTFLDR